MSLTRLLAVARKEIVQILRDARSLIIVVLMLSLIHISHAPGRNPESASSQPERAGSRHKS